MTQVRFTCGELRDIIAIMELLDSQSNGDAISQLAGGALEWHAGDECDGWIEWDDGQFWFVPASNKCEARQQALDELTEQAQDLDMGY